MQTSANRNVKYMLKNLKHNQRLFTILSLLMAVGLIIGSASFLAAAHLNNSENKDYLRSVFTGMIIVGTCVFAFAVCIYVIVSPIQMFSYNLMRSKTDMVYALPVKKRNRFFADFAGGLISILIPYIIFGVIASVIVGIGINCLSEDVLKNVNAFCLISTTFLIGMLALITAYSIIAFVCQFTGTIADAVIFTVLLIAEIPATILVISTYATEQALHINYSPISSLVYGTNPIGMVAYAFKRFSNLTDVSSTSDFDFPFWFFVLLSALTIIITFVFAYIASQKRKAEDTGKSIAFDLIFYIQMAIVAIASVALGFYISEIFVTLVSGFIGAALIYMLVKRGKLRIKIVVKNIIILCVAGGITASFMGALESTHSFEYGSKVPSASIVKSINTTIVNENGRSCTITYTDPDDIKQLVEFNRQGIKSDDSASNKDTSEQYKKDVFSNTATFEYKLKSGFSKNRSCNFSHIEDGKSFYEFIYQTDEYKEALANEMKEAVVYYENSYENSFGKEIYNNQISIGDGMFSSVKEISLSKDETKELKSEIYIAALKDYKERTLEEEFDSDVYITLNDFAILTSDENIINVLKNRIDTGLKTSDMLKEQKVTIIDPADYYIMNSLNSEEDTYSNDYYSPEYIGSFENIVIPKDEFREKKQEHDENYGNYKTMYFNYIVVSDSADRKDDITIEKSKDLYKFYCMRNKKQAIEDKNNEYYIMIFTDYGTTVFVPKNSETEAIYKSF